ncbi:MAG TPA: serine/threonine-protein kinase [Thermoanaerobaculia bacterium]|jgi:serine/threonine protein kinase|nr:serine/threonine-protein kinase [Thermoanaerobaculia bacterium]
MTEIVTLDPPPFPEVIPMSIVMAPGRYQRGDWIHEYEIETFVDEHEFGEIYDARDKHGNRVQIKLYFAFAQGDAREALQAELDASSLRHPNILAVLRVGPDANQFYLVMPFSEHRTLADWLRTRRDFRKQDAFRILHQLAFALSYLHDHGIVHCDLSPSVVVVADGTPLVQIGDFARARLDRCPLRPRRYAGASPFAAPELSREPVSAAPSLDVFSMAVIVFVVLTGAPPSRRDDTGEWDLRLIEEYVPELAPLLALMLSNDPTRRPAASAVMHWVAPLLTNPSIPPRETQFTK